MSFEPQLRYRRRWARWIIAAIIVLALLAGVLTWLQGRSQADPEPGLSPSAAPTTAPTRTDAARVANGCLGGPAITAQTVLTAQQQAQLDDVGAAEFAATFDRWAGEKSLPPADEVPVVLEAVTAPDATEAVTGIPERFQELGAPTEREGPPSSTVDGGYYIESSTADEVVVSVLLTVPGSMNSSGDVWATATTYTLDRSTEVWLLVDIGQGREVSDLAEIAQPFSGGC